ncbi:hypothetical protein BLA6993_05021 [Burkholderia lata]|nr:hypothetical protein BLA6993_05021 [Burkholderia lata]
MAINKKYTIELMKLIDTSDRVVSLLASCQHPMLSTFQGAWDAGRDKYWLRAYLLI